MEHLAIMKKSWKLSDKILSGEKTIESRWYKNKAPPWGKIYAGETVYFKNSGEPITIKAKVKQVIQYSSLTQEKVEEILKNYHLPIGIPADKIKTFSEQFKNKHYCILIFIKDPKKIEPFEINKKGFGNMAAWITIKSIENIKIKN